MMDFLKAFPFISQEEYKWKFSLPMIKLMSADNTRVNYLSEKQAEQRKSKTIDKDNINVLNDMGYKVFGF
jgi:hypothetical protein